MKNHISLKKYFFLCGLSLLLIAADQISKYVISHRYANGQKNPIIDGFLYLTHCNNTGAAWSIFSGRATALGLVSLAAVLAIGVLLFYTKSTGAAIALSAVLAGAAGNMIDRLWHGYVVDFLDFIIFGYDFPVFNVADICVVCGGIGLIAVTFFSGKDARLFYRPGFLSRRKESV